MTGLCTNTNFFLLMSTKSKHCMSREKTAWLARSELKKRRRGGKKKSSPALIVTGNYTGIDFQLVGLQKEVVIPKVVQDVLSVVWDLGLLSWRKMH